MNMRSSTRAESMKADLTPIDGGRSLRARGGMRLVSGILSLVTVGGTALAVATPAVANASSVKAHISTTAGTYVPLTPYRVADTRTGATNPATYAGKTLAAGATQNIQVTGTGTGSDAVPSTNVSAVVLNVTAINNQTSATAGGGYLTVFPQGDTQPTTSSLNIPVLPAGGAVANLVTVPVESVGGVSIYNFNGNTDVAVDVEGYYTTASSTSGYYNAVGPTRILDTRSTSSTIKTFTAAQTQNVTVANTLSDGVPSTASAVVLNVTAVNNATSASAGNDYLSVFPTGATMPTVSNLNFSSLPAGGAIANRVTVPLGTGGAVSIYNAVGSIDVLVDVDGYYTGTNNTSGSTFIPVAPIRMVDTRSSTGGSALAASANAAFKLTNSSTPANAIDAVANVTAIDSTGMTNGYLSVYPTTATAAPSTSDVNWNATTPASALVVPNMVIAPLNSSGQTQIANGPGDTANVLVDVVGFFTGGPQAAYTITSTPSPATAAIPSSGAAYTNTATNVSYSVAGVPTGTTVTIALFPSSGTSAPVTTAGSTTFLAPGAPAAPTAGTAQGEGTTNQSAANNATAASITSVNGAPITTPNRNQVSVGSVSGTVTFTVNSVIPDGTIPVVFADTSSNGNFLAVNASGQPTEAYGVGSTATWTPQGATLGTFNLAGVTGVNTATTSFTADPAGGAATLAGSFTYSWKASDIFQVATPALPAAVDGTTMAAFIATPTSCVNVTESAFLAQLTTNDQVIGSYAGIGSGAGSSTFCLNPIAPAAPQAVAVAQDVTNPTSQLDLTITNPTGTLAAAVTSFNVYRATATGSTPACPSVTAVTGAPAHGTATSPMTGLGFTKIGSVTMASGATTTYNDGNLSATTDYCYAVTSVDSNSVESASGTTRYDGTTANGAAMTDYYVATASAAAATTPFSTNIAVAGCSALSGCTVPTTIAVTFSSAVTVASTFSLTVTDGTNTAVVSNSNATATVSGNTVTYSVTGTVTSSPGVISGTSGEEIVSQTGVSNSVGAWNVAGSALVTAGTNTLATGTTTTTREINAVNSTIVGKTAAVDNGAGTAVASGNNTVTITGGCINGDNINVYTSNGLLISPTGSSQVVCAATNATVTTTTTFSPGQALIVTQQPTGGYESAGLVVTAPVTFSPSPIATTSSLAAAGTITVTAQTQAGATASLKFGSTSLSNQSAKVNNATALTGALVGFSANASGQISITYMAASPLAGGGTVDTITASATGAVNGVSSVAATSTDTYTY